MLAQIKVWGNSFPRKVLSFGIINYIISKINELFFLG